MEHETGMTNDIEGKSLKAFDQRILSGLLRGDGSAWGEFYDHYKGRLDRFFERNNVYDEDDREDLLQDTLRAIFESLPHYDPEQAPFRSWVYGVARNVMRRAQRLYSQQYAMEESGDLVLAKASLAVGNPDGDGDSEGEGPRLNVIRRALESLSDGDREILILRATRLTTWDELAQELGKGTSAVKMRHKRAMSRLKDALGGSS